MGLDNSNFFLKSLALRTVLMKLFRCLNAEEHAADKVETHEERNLPVCTQIDGDCCCNDMEVKSKRVKNVPLVDSLVDHVWDRKSDSFILQFNELCFTHLVNIVFSLSLSKD
jgi:hypothetical protein